MGGCFDGVFGVLVVFEVLEMFEDCVVEILVFMEVVVWINEEGFCFVFGVMGLCVFSSGEIFFEWLEVRD